MRSKRCRSCRRRAKKNAREALWSRLEAASFLTDDEKRAVIGYGPKVVAKGGASPFDFGAGSSQKFNPNHDGLGRFTFGDGGGNGADTLVGDAGTDVLAASIVKPAVQALIKLLKPFLKLKPSAQKLDEILKPGGKERGIQAGGAREGIRTLEKEQFETLKSELMDGAVEVPGPASYPGKTFQRLDGSVIGVRQSEKFGETIEVINSVDKAILENGYKVHSK